MCKHRRNDRTCAPLSASLHARLRASLEAASSESSALREQLSLFAGTDLSVPLAQSSAAAGGDGGSAASTARNRLHSLQLALLSSQSELERCERSLRVQTAANEALANSSAAERQRHADEVEALHRRLAEAEALADSRLWAVTSLEARVDELLAQRSGHGGGHSVQTQRSTPPRAAANVEQAKPMDRHSGSDELLSPDDVALLAAWLADDRGGT